MSYSDSAAAFERLTRPPAPTQFCGPGPDDRYCARFHALSTENERLGAETRRLRSLIHEALDCTALDDEERAEWLERAGIHSNEEEGEDEER